MMKDQDVTNLLLIVKRKSDPSKKKISAREICEDVIAFLEGRTFSKESTQKQAGALLAKARALHEFITGDRG